MSFAIASRSPDSTVLKGSTSASSGLALTRAGTRSRQYTTWLYMGCSTHSVPSWSKVAMRSSGGTKSGLDVSVVAFTKSTIACFAAPSFQEGNASVAEGTSREGDDAEGSCRKREMQALASRASEIRKCRWLSHGSPVRGDSQCERATLSGRPLAELCVDLPDHWLGLFVPIFLT